MLKLHNVDIPRIGKNTVEIILKNGKISKKSKKHYWFIHPTLPTTIQHITEYHISRRYSDIITRIELKIGNFPTHLYNLSIVNSDKCSPDNESVWNLMHVFLCARHYWTKMIFQHQWTYHHLTWILKWQEYYE